MRFETASERPRGRGRVMTQRRNRAPAPCARCRTMVAPGDGRVWRCIGGDRCASPDTCVQGWHCSCLDEPACARRALAWKRDQVRRAKLSEELVANIAASIERDWTLQERKRARVAELVRSCAASLDGLLVELVGSEEDRVELAKAFDAIRAAAASVIARKAEEYDQVELVLSSKEGARGA